MKKTTKPAALSAAPTVIVAGRLTNDVAANLRVVDAATGEPIERVLDADADAGRVSRYAIEEGNLVREGDRFKIIDEDRAIRIEWIDPPIVDQIDIDAPVEEAAA